MRDEKSDAESFYKIMSKLPDEDLQTLTFIFGCTPNYVGDRPQDYYVQYLWGAPAKPIRIEGVEYPSIKEARRKLRKGNKTVMRMLENGGAEYV